MAEEKKTIILRLPPYHCEQIPIELIWAQGKRHVDRNSKTHKMKDVEGLLEEGVNLVTLENRQNCISHAIKVGTKGGIQTILLTTWEKSSLIQTSLIQTWSHQGLLIFEYNKILISPCFFFVPLDPAKKFHHVNFLSVGIWNSRYIGTFVQW